MEDMLCFFSSSRFFLHLFFVTLQLLHLRMWFVVLAFESILLLSAIFGDTKLPVWCWGHSWNSFVIITNHVSISTNTDLIATYRLAIDIYEHTMFGALITIQFIQRLNIRFEFLFEKQRKRYIAFLNRLVWLHLKRSLLQQNQCVPHLPQHNSTINHILYRVTRVHSSLTHGK